MGETAQDDGTTSDIQDVIDQINAANNALQESADATAIDEATRVIDTGNDVAVDDGTTAGINDVIEGMGETAQDDGTTAGINDVIQNMGETNPYEVQPWENLDNSGNYDGSMAGDFSLNSDKNTYTGGELYDRGYGNGYHPYDEFGASVYPQYTPRDGGFNLEGSYDFRGGDAFGSGYGGGGGGYFDNQGMSTMAMARGGIADAYYSLGGYSDGGRLLRGPGDGVSDSIPATIGKKKQPARLADGEFVIPARIVSELGNGSTEAGARKLYAMMDRIQATRGNTTGRNRVATNTRADRHLPA